MPVDAGSGGSWSFVSAVVRSSGSDLFVCAPDPDLSASVGCAGHRSDVALRPTIDHFEVGPVGAQGGHGDEFWGGEREAEAAPVAATEGDVAV